MHVASKELCAELYELSRWTVTPGHIDVAYSLGYLWRKLPPSIKIELEKRVYYDDIDEWSVDLTVWYGDSFYWTDDFTTAEDALASLLIRLFKDTDVELNKGEQ